jgi:hypothetical protein
MSDEELIARLREDDTDFWHCEAADRIEALTAKLTTCEEIGRAFEKDAGQLREKLAKAMTHVMDYSNDPHLVQFARTTLAEIKGEKP